MRYGVKQRIRGMLNIKQVLRGDFRTLSGELGLKS